MFEILTRAIDDAADRSTSRAGERLSQEFRQALEDWVRADVPRYTGEVLKGDRVRQVQLDRGEDVAASRPGVIQVLVNWGACTPGTPAVARVNWREPGILEGGRIELMANCGGLDRRAFSHQLAHHMGFSHAKDSAATMQPSILDNAHGDGPTAADSLHARVLYQRAPGNQAPDRDPPPRKLDPGDSQTTRRSTTIVYER